MPEVKWVDKGSLLTREEALGLCHLVPVITLDQLEAWLKAEHIYCTEEGLLKHLLAQVQAWKEGK